MGLWSWLLYGRGMGADQLARRLDIEKRELRRFKPHYRQFTIPKRSGGARRILAPDDDLKKLQRRILRRLLGRLRAHPAAMGFERNRSIVTNARLHVGRAAVLRMDVVDFFPTTSTRRVRKYLRRIGWNRQAARLLVRLCCHDGGLPQGAPTSPRLSNLVNYRLDARLAGMARKLGAVYTRYADDITVSFSEDADARELAIDWLDEYWKSPATGELIHILPETATAGTIRYMRDFVRHVAQTEGYRVHGRKKTSVRRPHHCQTVTGLVVNEKVNLPRSTRRWLRAVEHRIKLAQQPRAELPKELRYARRKQPTLSPAQLDGWKALQSMIEQQSGEETEDSP
jgi:RNA-directed DNA polymerase